MGRWKPASTYGGPPAVPVLSLEIIWGARGVMSTSSPVQTLCKAPVTPDKWLFLWLSYVFTRLQTFAGLDSRYRSVKVLGVWTMLPGWVVCDWIHPLCEGSFHHRPSLSTVSLCFLPATPTSLPCSRGLAAAAILRLTGERNVVPESTNQQPASSPGCCPMPQFPHL